MAIGEITDHSMHICIGVAIRSRTGWQSPPIGGLRAVICRVAAAGLLLASTIASGPGQAGWPGDPFDFYSTDFSTDVTSVDAPRHGSNDPDRTHKAILHLSRASIVYANGDDARRMPELPEEIQTKLIQIAVTCPEAKPLSAPACHRAAENGTSRAAALWPLRYFLLVPFAALMYGALVQLYLGRQVRRILVEGHPQVWFDLSSNAFSVRSAVAVFLWDKCDKILGDPELTAVADRIRRLQIVMFGGWLVYLVMFVTIVALFSKQ